MHDELYYVASEDDEALFRQYLVSLGLSVLPARPEYPDGLSEKEVQENRSRFLSLSPIENVRLDLKPFPHYNSVAAPLIEWEVPRRSGKVMVAGYLRHHPYMTKEGLDFAAIGKVFMQIKAWLKASWQPINQFDFMGPGAARLITEEGYSWSSFDPAHTTVETVRADGTAQELTYDEWIRSDEDRKG